MKITDRKPKAWIAVCCMVSLLFCSLSQASKPEDIYMTNADCLSLQVNNEYHTMVVSGYHPQRNAPHYQLVLPPGFIYQEKIYYIEKVAADVFAGQTFSQIYVMTEKGLSIGDQAFFNAKVQNISGSSVTDHAVEFEGDSLLGVGDYAFAGLQADSRFTIENMAGSIGVRAFENAVVRGTLTIGGQIGTLGVGAFSGTIARAWMLTADIRRVEEKAFQNANIQEFTIGESLQYLGSQAFQGSDLTRLYLPDGRFQGVVAQDAIPDKEGLTIVIPGGDTNLSAFHFENFQNAVFEVAASLPEDSAVMQFLREHQLQWKKTENTPAPDGDGSTPVPGGDGSTPAPSGSGTPATSQPGGVENTPMPDGDGSTPVPGGDGSTPAPSGSGTPATSQPGGVKNTPTPNGGFVKTDQGNGDVGTQQGSQHKDTNAHNEKKYFTSKKIKYRMTSGNQVVVRGATSKKLTKLSIPDTVTYQGRLYKVTAVSKKAFFGFTKLKRVYIGNYVKKIGDQAFSRCGCLQSVSFGRRMGVVGSKALYQDHSVKKVVFRGKLLKKIGKKAFWGVPKSVRITVPKSKAKQYKKLIRRSK